MLQHEHKVLLDLQSFKSNPAKTAQLRKAAEKRIQRYTMLKELQDAGLPEKMMLSITPLASTRDLDNSIN